MKHTNKTLFIVIIVLVLAVIGLVIQNQMVLKKTQEQTEKITYNETRKRGRKADSCPKK